MILQKQIGSLIHSVSRYEPARVVAVVVALIAALGSFGLYAFTEVQAEALIGLVASVLALLQGEMTRDQVFPVEKVRDGSPMFYDEVIRSDAYDEELYR